VFLTHSCVFVNFILVLFSYVLMLKIIGAKIIDPKQFYELEFDLIDLI